MKGARKRRKSFKHFRNLACLCCISLWDVTFHANTERFRGLVPLLPHLCPLSVPEVGVCGVYSESP